MNINQTKAMIEALKELNESYVDLMRLVKGATREAKKTEQLWRDGNNSKIIKLGLALIVFPEPTPISETVGTCLLAAGTVQKAIRTRSIYVEDVYKTFQDTLRDLFTKKHNLRI